MLSWILLEFDLPVLTGEDLHAAVLAKKSTSGGLDGWALNELKALPLSWFVRLAWVLRLVEDTGLWPEGLLDAYITLIPKRMGTLPRWGNAPFASSLLFIGFGHRFG